MNRAATFTSQEAHYKARAEHYLAETQKILRQLATELATGGAACAIAAQSRRTGEGNTARQIAMWKTLTVAQ